MDDTVKLTSINTVLGIIAGVLSALFTVGTFGFKNDMLGLIIAIIFVYGIVYCLSSFHGLLYGFYYPIICKFP